MSARSTRCAGSRPKVDKISFSTIRLYSYAVRGLSFRFAARLSCASAQAVASSPKVAAPLTCRLAAEGSSP